MIENTTTRVGRRLTATTLCSVLVLNAAMYGCAGAPDGTGAPADEGSNGSGSGSARTLTPKAAGADASATVSADASTAALQPKATRLGLKDLTSRLSSDIKGKVYETKFERLANELLAREAATQAGFFAVLEKAFGASFNHDKAESIRQQILKGDFSWAPQVRIVDDEELNGMLGAYSAKSGTVYLSRSVPSKLERTFIYIEELGHHLDTLLNQSDAPGDEGALFRVALTGEAVPADMIAMMRADNHAGTIMVDGVAVHVEFLFGIDWFSDALGAAWNGLKSGANYVWKGATTAGGAIKTAATKSWDGAKTLSGWIAKGADIAANKFVEALNRDFWAAYQTVNGAANVLITAGYGTLEGMKVITQGLSEIAKGNLLDGTANIFTGLAKLAVEMPLDTLSTAVLDSIGVLQTALFLEPIGRYLTQAETDAVTWVFGSQWWVPLIRIKEGFAGIFSASPRPFTNQFNIYLKDYAAVLSLVIHESTHVWQFANGGGDYKLQSLYEQYVKGKAYNWEPSVNNGTQWERLGVEQQASFVEAAYISGCYDGANYDFGIQDFKKCVINLVDRTAYFNGVDDKIWSGTGAP
jgi:hypothetical protein